MKNRIALLPNIITAFGLSCGLFVIFKVNLIVPGQLTYIDLIIMTALLMLAGVADMLDGAVARMMGVESEFGCYFDSFADAVSFGLAPVLIVLKTLSLERGTDLSFLVTASAMVYSVCGLLRLVRYNVMSEIAKEDHEEMVAHKKNFTGLPIPAAAAAVCSVNFFLISPELKRFVTVSSLFHALMMMTIMFVIGYFMISQWKFPSLKTLQIRVGSFQIVAMTVIFSAILFYGFLKHFSIVFLLISWSYVIVAWILSVIRILAGRKSKTLEDFEPEPELEC